MRQILCLMFFLCSCAKFLPSVDQNKKNITTASNDSSNDISVFHYNIKELTSEKLLHPENTQILAVKKILKKQKFDILSINEIQYDLPGVPTFEYTSQGENFVRLASVIGLNSSGWTPLFAPANTGTAAKRNINGAYFVEESEAARLHADPINYGLFPGQYSTAGLIKTRVNEKSIINDLKWSSFNPQLSPSEFSMPNGRSLPHDMFLFDKNFNHAVSVFNNKIVHIIFLHTVPSYHFGNKNTPNYQRNADQLKFLEWYITGKTDFDVPLDRSRWPAIKKDDAVIVIGDLNADINQKDNLGGIVLTRLMKTLRPWMQNPGPTNESSGFDPNPFKLSLDYILVSHNIRIVEAGVLRPESNFTSLGCTKSAVIKVKRNLRARRKIVEYFDKTKKKTCYATVSQAYYDAKMASDHFPIYAKLSLD